MDEEIPLLMYLLPHVELPVVAVGGGVDVRVALVVAVLHVTSPDLVNVHSRRRYSALWHRCRALGCEAGLF